MDKLRLSTRLWTDSTSASYIGARASFLPRPGLALSSPPNRHLCTGRRENTTAQYLSWKTAVETDCWETSPQEQAANPACAEKVTQLGDDWPEFQEGVRAWYNVSETACRNAGKPVVFVSMEEYLAPKWQTYTQEVDVLMRAKVKLP